ncbi:hypothetical protein [Neisseria bergeri]|uniref:hypothetical protein n=1 Tax=Neisseria bergeri TaxID=1906581 RepID=UPI001863B178|nr:hypothetical protein [Neisseria bergeri]
MPSEALSDGIFYCLCRFVPGRQCLAARHCYAAIWVFRRHRGLQTALSHRRHSRESGNPVCSVSVFFWVFG